MTLGNLVTVPLGGGLLSVEPVYVQASATTNSGSYPQLKEVLTYYNGQVGFAQHAGRLAGPGLRQRGPEPRPAVRQAVT